MLRLLPSFPPPMFLFLCRHSLFFITKKNPSALVIPCLCLMSLFWDCLKRRPFRPITHLVLHYSILYLPWSPKGCMANHYPFSLNVSLLPLSHLLPSLSNWLPSTAKALLQIPPTFPHDSAHTLFPLISTLQTIRSRTPLLRVCQVEKSGLPHYRNHVSYGWTSSLPALNTICFGNLSTE